MSIKKLTTSLDKLTAQESEFTSTESAALKLLKSIKIQEHVGKVDEFVTLVESVTQLRRLVHVQLRSLLLELRDQQRGPLSQVETQSSQTEDHLVHDSTASHKDKMEQHILREDTPRIEKSQATPKPLVITEKPEEFSSEIPSEPPPPSPPAFFLDETPLADELEDLEELKREVAFLTSPHLNFNGINEADLAPTLESEQRFPFDISDLPNNIEELPHPPHSPSQEGLAQASPSDEAVDLSSAFPESAGEAGTAIFNIDEYTSKNSSEPQINKAQDLEPVDQTKNLDELSLFEVEVSTPHAHFTARTLKFTETELMLSAEHSLLRGEEVQLSFTLPQLCETIECKGLVRPRRSTDLHEAKLFIRFLNLRPSQLSAIQEEIG